MSAFPAVGPLADWEIRWAPYDEPTYQAVLARVRPEDTVLEIGAGDLRLARRLANIARQVYAIEIQAGLLRASSEPALPPNLTLLPGDARTLPYPQGVSLAVLLMRHCTHYRLYAARLRQAGVQRLVTNARWKMDVETIDLATAPLPYAQASPGWFACDCGAVGFKCASVEELTAETLGRTAEVVDCPHCTPYETLRPADNKKPAAQKKQVRSRPSK